MNLLKYISPLSFALILVACADESPMEVIEDDISDADYQASNRASNYKYEKSNCEHGISSYSDSWCCSNYGLQCSTYESEGTRCYYGTSSYSDSWCCSNYGYRCSYVYSSSSAKSSSSYLFQLLHTQSQSINTNVTITTIAVTTLTI